MREISDIAYEIKKDWKNINYAAVPYLEAMFILSNIDQMYYNDTAKSIVLYFLSNASSWRGETAKRIKNELKIMVK